MKDILIVVGSNEGKNSNSYYISKYIRRILKDEANFTNILLNEINEENIEKEIQSLKKFDNMIVIANLRKDELNQITYKFLEEFNKFMDNYNENNKLYLSFILNGDIDTLNKAEEINPILEKCNSLCKSENIIWQKGIGSLSNLEFWKKGLESDDGENNQLILEIEMFCQDIKNNKTYHHNSFATSIKGKGILAFLNKKLQQFN